MQRHASPQSYRTRPIGLFYYKEFPSVQHPIFNGLVLEALAYAYRLSGDRDYILKGMRTLESILINMNFQLVVSPGGKKTAVNGAILKGAPAHSSGRSELRRHHRTVDSLPGGGG